jgi:hypothetical protein
MGWNTECRGWFWGLKLSELAEIVPKIPPKPPQIVVGSTKFLLGNTGKRSMFRRQNHNFYWICCSWFYYSYQGSCIILPWFIIDNAELDSEIEGRYVMADAPESPQPENRSYKVRYPRLSTPGRICSCLVEKTRCWLQDIDQLIGCLVQKNP